MEISDISCLVFSYLVTPTHRLIERFDRQIGGFIKFNIKSNSNWFIAQNPCPYIIRKVNKLESFDDPTYLAACYANPSGHQITHLMNNLHKLNFYNLINIKNPEIAYLVATQYFPNLKENLKYFYHCEQFTKFCSNPSNVLTQTSLDYLSDDKSASWRTGILKGLCANPNQFAVTYIENIWDKIKNNEELLIKAASNPNPLIVQLVSNEINISWSLARKLIRELSTNPSAVSILEKYPEHIDFLKLVSDNPSPEAAKLFIKYINRFDPGYVIIRVGNGPTQEIPVENLLNNPNIPILELYIAHGMSWRKNGSSRVTHEILCHLHNPGMFPISKSHTNHKVKLVSGFVSI